MPRLSVLNLDVLEGRKADAVFVPLMENTQQSVTNHLVRDDIDDEVKDKGMMKQNDGAE